ncbi:hypothetical protein K470DRAFT_258993 [Piedraia hortae CBS 480.64]|uniref:Uncharacterized protein n=1 Tax=Piedraia hortae CBS 480.64 TaxID=1314780 RepID=A0A6A7BW56_9PEZI|nr:hypothetical protein K470DRAFT_258993 [Piedraia hortae CBS 480.64]
MNAGVPSQSSPSTMPSICSCGPTCCVRGSCADLSPSSPVVNGLHGTGSSLMKRTHDDMGS